VAEEGREVARVGIGPTLDRFLAIVGAVELLAMAGSGKVADSPPLFELPAARGSGGAMRCTRIFDGGLRTCVGD
jgi:hypothetical protein